MISRRAFLCESAALGISLVPGASSALESRAWATDYPAGPVKIMVAQAAGGSLDVLLRISAEYLSRAWGKQVIVLNMPAGGVGVIAARAAAAAAPDGYTLFMAGKSIFTILPEIQADLSFNVDDFVPVALTGEQPFGIVVSPSLGVTSLPELIALSKSQPGGLNCAVGARNSSAHLTAELLRERSGANLNFINYSGTSQSLNDVIAGRIPMLVQIIPGIAGAIAAGQVKLLSITSRTRWRTFPDVPTTSEAVPGFVVGGWTVLVAPPGTPAAIVKKVNDDLRASQAQPEFKDKLAHLGAEAPPMSPRQLADFIRSEREFWRPLVRKVAANTQ